MSLIQLLLIGGGAVCFFAYLFFFRSVLRDRLVVMFLFALGAVAVFFPDGTTTIAKMLGVGRGTDLVFYLFMLGGVFAGILLYGKIAKIERTQTEIVRALAIRSASAPDKE